jgi:hypothetical protein
MGAEAPRKDTVPRPRWTAVALPAEHGGWGLLLEPIAVGLSVAPSWPGLGLSLAALCVFLARLPVRLALQDRLRRAFYPRTRLAWRLAVAFGSGAAAFGLPSLLGAPRAAWLTLGLVAPLGLVQLAFDLRNRGRELLPELLGAVALSASAPLVALLGGAPSAVAFAAGTLIALRSLSAVVYVRARLRRTRGLPAGRAPAVLGHVLALGVAVGLAGAGLGPWLGVVAFVLLAARAFHGLRPAPPVRAQVVGVQEVVWGVVTVVLLAMGYRAGW